MEHSSPWHYMTQKVYGYFTTSCLAAACHFKVADIIDNECISIQKLAIATQTHTSALYRLMRFLSSQDIFIESPKGHFQNNPNSALLKENHPQSIHSFSLFHGLDMSWKSWLNLTHSIETGLSATEHTYGMTAFEVMEKEEKTLGLFSTAMNNLALADAAVIHEYYDFSPYERIADIGGGNGAFLKAILSIFPSKKGIIFDQAHVMDTNPVSAMPPTIILEAGSFFEAIPIKADLYIARHIIHDWDDVKSLKIIRNIKSNMTSKSKLLIIELLMDKHSHPSIAKYRDMNMLVTMNGGYERTLEEYQALFKSASLHLNQVIALPTHMNLLEFTL